MLQPASTALAPCLARLHTQLTATLTHTLPASRPPPPLLAVGVETLNLELVGQDELEAVLNRCSGFVLGSPTLGGHMPTQVQTALGTILSNGHARTVPCSVFGSFGWSGEAVDKMEKRLKVRTGWASGGAARMTWWCEQAWS